MIELEARYQDITAKMKLAVVIIDTNQESPDVKLNDQNEDTDEVEKEEEEEDKEEEKVEPKGGWDGWKVLLLLDLNLGEDFKLPEPITTPGYIATPPKASLNKISIEGDTSISFNEPVFQL